MKNNENWNTEKQTDFSETMQEKWNGVLNLKNWKKKLKQLRTVAQWKFH